MPSPKSAPMPTPKRVIELFEAVRAVCPGVRIARVGPEGVTFDYPGAASSGGSEWEGRPFTDGADP
jgi:hypothetical protein